MSHYHTRITSNVGACLSGRRGSSTERSDHGERCVASWSVPLLLTWTRPCRRHWKRSQVPGGARSIEQRAALFHRCADAMEEDLEAFALAESQDTGKPLTLARTMVVPRAIADFLFFAGYLLHGAQDVRHQGGGDLFGGAVPSSSGPTLTALNYSMRKPVDWVVGLITPCHSTCSLGSWLLHSPSETLSWPSRRN